MTSEPATFASLAAPVLRNQLFDRPLTWRGPPPVGHSGGVPTETLPGDVPGDSTPLPDDESPTLSRWRITPLRIFYVLVVVAIIAMWAFVYSPLAVGNAPDALYDTSVGPRAEAICKQTADQLARLPAPFDTPDPNQRADVVQQSNTDLSAMLDQLAAVPWAPVTDQESSDRDHRIYNEWLGDWRTYLANRVDYANRLRTDRDARIFEAQKGSKQITEPIGGFAQDSLMPSCAPPGDIF
jgi:hypothetical protein